MRTDLSSNKFRFRLDKGQDQMRMNFGIALILVRVKFELAFAIIDFQVAMIGSQFVRSVYSMQ